MKFRKIYWVTEQLGPDGHGVATGVYTSIHDLVTLGLRRLPGLPMDGFRVTLCKLDAAEGALGSWQSPEFENLESDLQEFVKTQEIGSPEVDFLAESVRQFAGA